MKKIRLIIGLILSTSIAQASWDSPKDWYKATDKKSQIDVSTATGRVGDALQIRYLNPTKGWVFILKEIPEDFSSDRPLVFWIKSDSRSTLEVRAIDDDGSIFSKKFPLKDKYYNWKRLSVGRKTLTYDKNGNDKLDTVVEISFAIIGPGKGTVWLDEIGWGEIGEETSATPKKPQDQDPSGYGFRQRRAKKMIKEKPRVFKWLKVNQDTSSPDRNLLSSSENDIAETYSNALAAMVFILKKEKQRAEMILDFYAKSVDPNNAELMLQNFFFNKEARGFYDKIHLTGEKAYTTIPEGTRSVRDMAWLLIAYKHYEKTYGAARYSEVKNMILSYLTSLFREDDQGGYISNGWADEDKEFNTIGYGTPNVSCMAAFRLYDQEAIAEDLYTWLDARFERDQPPLEAYTLYALAFNKKGSNILNIPGRGLKHQEPLKLRGEEVTGFIEKREEEEEIWLSGLGQMACAQFNIGNKTRSNFYANQMDKFLNEIGTKKPNIDAACWYIFAKNRFNPFLLKQF